MDSSAAGSEMELRTEAKVPGVVRNPVRLVAAATSTRPSSSPACRSSGRNDGLIP
jgi:hypothetical protein